MPPDRNLRLGQRWVFNLVDPPFGPAPSWWAWEVRDSAGNKVLESGVSFETLTECIENAREHGYVEPEER